MKKLLLAACVLPLLAGAWALGEDAKKHDHEHGEPPLPKHGVAVLIPTEGNKVQGTLMLDSMGAGLHIHGMVKGLTPGKHGFHIHEFGDLRSPDGSAAGGHYNPDGKPHGGPGDDQHHGGDLGNITAGEDGTAKVDIKAPWLKLHFVLGRAFVVHAGEDDLESQPSGDAGGRVALGLIGIAAKPAATKKSAATKQ